MNIVGAAKNITEHAHEGESTLERSEKCTDYVIIIPKTHPHYCTVHTASMHLGNVAKSMRKIFPGYSLPVHLYLSISQLTIARSLKQLAATR
jgi:hypothetical protein